jgi:hypothetical protein
MAAWWEISRTSEARLKWLSALLQRAEDGSRVTYLAVPLKYLPILTIASSRAGRSSRTWYGSGLAVCSSVEAQAPLAGKAHRRAFSRATKIKHTDREWHVRILRPCYLVTVIMWLSVAGIQNMVP